ncbi:MAG: ribosome-binding factor A [Alteromonas naphthalenivorans]|jgi:ribosome-binding factor A
MTKLSDVKRAQKASLLFRTICNLFLEATLDNKELARLVITQVKLSPDKSKVYAYFYAPEGKEVFDELFPLLKMYKPSLRAAIAKSIAGRYTPDIMFKFDGSKEKSNRLEALLCNLKDEGEL